MDHGRLYETEQQSAIFKLSYVQTALYKTCTVGFRKRFFQCVRPNRPSKAKSQSHLFLTNLTCFSLSVLPFSTARETPMKVPGNLNAIQSSVNITDFRLGFHRKKQPTLLARETPLKVSGNLNAIQSSVNITDFRLSFHKKKSRYQRKRV